MSIQTAVLEVVNEYDPSTGGGKYGVSVKTPDGEMLFPIAPGGVIPRGEIYTIYRSKEETGPKPKSVSKKRQKRASIAQENEVMEELGGRRQAGSGAVGHLKGDGRVRDKYRVEIKYTRTKSYRVDRDELSKIRGECTAPEEPLFVIDFKDPETGGSEDRWVMVPFHVFKKLDNATTDDSRSEKAGRGARASNRTGSKAR